ncbi:MAG: peptidoglycan editing factor PgeF [Thermodesulfovibrionia bacterium]
MNHGYIIRPPNLLIEGLEAFFSTKGYNNELGTGSEVTVGGEVTVWNGRVFYPTQRHTDDIHILNDRQEDVIADAVITNNRGILIGIRVADCVPILIYDKGRDIIGAVHAGWRGTAKGILKKAIKAMLDIYGSAKEDILIAIGPSIRGCCYEVGDDVIKPIHDATGEGRYYKGTNGRYYLDLSMANMIQAQSIGILQESIWCSDECTFCNPSRFYSYRYTGGSTGRQGGFIGMW